MSTSSVELLESREDYDAIVAASSSCAFPPLTVQLDPSRPIENALPWEYIDAAWLGGRAVVVRNVLSPEECADCIRFMSEAPEEMVAATSRTDYRNNFRRIVQSKAFGAELLRRLTPVLEELQQAEKVVDTATREWYHDNGLGMEGTWRVAEMNSCFRMCFYKPGGHFAPHYDSDFVVDPLSLRSFKTMMIYLNDSYQGGETNFLEEHQLYWDDARSLYCAPPGAVRAQLKARTGDCIVFDHKILHEGAQVVSGVKYMMRSEIIYQLQAPCKENDTNMSQSLKEAILLLQRAKLHEGNGEMDQAVACYRKAFRLHPELQRHT